MDPYGCKLTPTEINPFYNGGNEYSSASVPLFKWGAFPGDSIPLTGDLNHDGLPDAIIKYANENINKSFTKVVEQPDLLTSVTDGFGAKISFEYSTLTDRTPDNLRVLYQTSSESPKFPLSRANRNTRVVHTYTDKLGNASHYQYQDAISDLHGRGFLGFKQITINKVNLGQTEVTKYAMGFPHNGQVVFHSTEKADVYMDYTTPADMPTTSVIQTRHTEKYSIGSGYRYLAGASKEFYQYASEGYLTHLSVAEGDRFASSAHSFTSVINNIQRHKNITFSDFSWDTSNWLLYGGKTVTTTIDGKSSTRSVELKQGTLDVEIETLYKGTANQVITTKTFDYAGRIESVETVAADISTQHSSSSIRKHEELGFSAAGLPKLVINGAQHEARYKYDNRFGLPIEQKMYSNNLATYISYDFLGRMVSTVKPDESQISVIRYYCDNAATGIVCPDTGVYFKAIRVTSPTNDKLGAPLTIAFFDKLQRKVREQVYNVNGEPISTDTEYYDNGYVHRVSAPFMGVQAQHWHTMSNYDVVGRPLLEVGVDGGTKTTTYGSYLGFVTKGVTVSVKDENGVELSSQTTLEQYDNLGRTFKITDTYQTEVEYGYDGFDNLTSTIVNQDQDTKITIEYDIAGNKTLINDPDAGEINFEYNAYGELRRQTWAPDTSAQKYMEVSYDSLGRNTLRYEQNYNSQAKIHRWYWDEGKLGTLSRKTTGGDFHEAYSYDALNRLESRVVSASGMTTATFDYTYDAFSRQLTVEYPTGLKVKHEYHTNGELVRTRNANDSNQVFRIIGNQYDSRGRQTEFWLGNQVKTEYSYNQRSGLVADITTGKLAAGTDGSSVTGNIQQLSYQFDSIGNLRLRSSMRHEIGQWSQEDITEQFDYDDLNRLTGANTYGIGAIRTQLFDYDELGNLTLKTDSSIGLNQVLKYEKIGNAGVHAVTSAGETKYSYDAYGNIKSKILINGQVTTLDYNVFNKPTRIDNVNFKYGPDQKRYRQDNSDGITYYVDDYQEQIRGNQRIQKVYIGDYLVETKFASNSTLHYLHHNHLGSVEAISDENGNYVDRMRFDAWGKRQLSNWTTGTLNVALLRDISTKGFTGHEQLDDVGLVHMNGRVYDPEIGRFLTPDIIIQSPKNSQSFNRYSYVLNNPLSLVDPTGFTAEECNSSDKACTDTEDAAKKGVEEDAEEKARELAKSKVLARMRLACGVCAIGAKIEVNFAKAEQGVQKAHSSMVGVSDVTNEGTAASRLKNFNNAVGSEKNISLDDRYFVRFVDPTTGNLKQFKTANASQVVALFNAGVKMGFVHAQTNRSSGAITLFRSATIGFQGSYSYHNAHGALSTSALVTFTGAQFASFNVGHELNHRAGSEFGLFNQPHPISNNRGLSRCQSQHGQGACQ
ncbi:hypothetical protein C2869_09370 [Saccharobesus litoralis]|uniref:Uncharacterized protein n=2 Tax=Saccharobesus litoralis TaxID=2172099 RepID=A0A2S0VQY1_9ALTE|nr:hypothetical protein C2869_09370 [Saccharobesus litoralis]